jgi:hypothetical protein
MNYLFALSTQAPRLIGPCTWRDLLAHELADEWCGVEVKEEKSAEERGRSSSGGERMDFNANPALK